MTRVRTTSGFTLMELVLVLVILAVALMIAAPSLASFGRGRATEEAAASFVALTHWARSQAISDGVIYRVNVDSAQGKWWLTVDDNGQFVSVNSEYGRQFSVPDGVRIETDIPLLDGTPAVEFDPGARTDPATVRFIDQQGNTVAVVCENPRDVFHIVKGGTQ